VVVVMHQQLQRHMQLSHTGMVGICPAANVKEWFQESLCSGVGAFKSCQKIKGAPSAGLWPCTAQAHEGWVQRHRSSLTVEAQVQGRRVACS
jgi:hypothetical protein